MNNLLISHSLQNAKFEKKIERLQQEINNLKTEKKTLKKDLEFYKSLFKTHSNSVVFNLTIKSKNGEKIWEYINRSDNNKLYRLNWSRIIDLDIEKFKQNLINKNKCVNE